jgi:hypothetical protein
MTEEATSLEQGTENAPEVPVAAEAPTDFREYVRWRGTGELPEKEEKPAAAGEGAAPATEPQAETAPDSGTDDNQETGEEEEPKRRPDSRQRKIAAQQREIDELRQKLEQKPPAAEEPGQKPKAPPDGKPKLEDFSTLEEYQEALTDWKLDERERKRQAADAEREAREAHEKIQAAWSKQVKAAAKVHEDYDDVIDSVKAPEGPGVEAARLAMLEDENGAEILYHLGKHPADLKRIAALSPVSAVREIGKLSAKFTSPTAPENGKPKVTGAPKPPPPSGRPSKVASESLDDPEVLKDYPRWERLRKAQLGRK